MPKVRARKKQQSPEVLPSTGEVVGEPVAGIQETTVGTPEGVPQSDEPMARDPEPPEPPKYDGVWLNTVPLVDGADAEVRVIDGALVARRPGVDGTDELDPIPEMELPFEGFVVPMGLSIRESNGVVGDRVVGICRWQITMNGVLVYSPRIYSATLRDALFEAGWAVQRLVKQMETSGVRWWDERYWRGRVVFYQARRWTVGDHWPSTGSMYLVPEGGEASDGREVGMLDEGVVWLRPEEGG